MAVIKLVGGPLDGRLVELDDPRGEVPGTYTQPDPGDGEPLPVHAVYEHDGDAHAEIVAVYRYVPGRAHG